MVYFLTVISEYIYLGETRIFWSGPSHVSQQSARLIRIETIIRPGEGRVLELVVEVVEVEGLGDFDECCSMSASWTGPACFPTKCIQILPI